MHRIYNFSSGPAVLPVPVLEEAQRDLVALPGIGMSILEISHRSAAFEAIIRAAEANLRLLAGIPETHAVRLPAGRSQPPVLDGPDESAHVGHDRRLHPDRIVVAESGQGSEACGAGSCCGDDGSRRVQSNSCDARAHADARAPRTSTSRRTTRLKVRHGIRCRMSGPSLSSATHRQTF